MDAYATADAGGSDTAGAKATATAIGDGTGGTVQATASSTPQGQTTRAPTLINSIQALASAEVGTSATAFAETLYGAAVPAFDSTDAAVGTGVAAPDAADTNPVLAANGAINTAFGASPSFFSMGEVGGGHASAAGGAESSTASVTTAINLADPGASGNLVFGLYGGAAVGSGVTGVTLTVTGNGATYLNEAFGSGAAAQAGFTDQAFNFGALGSSGVLDLVVSLTVQTDQSGSGFYGDFVAGDPPGGGAGVLHPAAAALLAHW